MGVKILHGKQNDTLEQAGACLYDSVTGTAFGPILDDLEDAQRFIDFLEEQRPGIDPRQWSDHDLWEVMGPYRERFPSQ